MEGLEATVQAKGSYFKVAAEAMFLIDEFHAKLKRQDEGKAKAFREMVLEWAKGNLDD